MIFADLKPFQLFDYMERPYLKINCNNAIRPHHTDGGRIADFRGDEKVEISETMIVFKNQERQEVL